MGISRDLDLVANEAAYADVDAAIRWGQRLREEPEIADELSAARDGGRLVPLKALGDLRGGVVTRANAYFIVEELPFDEVPASFSLTESDYKKVAVVRDGIDALHRIERTHLKPIIKGPEMLLSPTEVSDSDRRLFVVEESKDALEERRATGALAYLKRGETISYDVSKDPKKGGIPAERSNIKNRQPHWYSLSIPDTEAPRIVMPEHIDSRYISTLVPAGDGTTVIDKLFVFTPHNPEFAPFILACLNSLLGYYQVEVRGRTQHGQGVLELKKPEIYGVLVPDPREVSEEQRNAVVESFGPVSTQRTKESLSTIGEEDRRRFDQGVVRLIDERINSESFRLRLERAVRALSSERKEKKESIADERAARRRSERAGIDIGAFASRIESMMDDYPDPRDCVEEGIPTNEVAITGSVDGEIEIGEELFDQGAVTAQDVVIAKADSPLGASFVRGVLLHDRSADTVEVPADEETLRNVIERWNLNVDAWKAKFDEVASKVTSPVQEEKVITEIKKDALRLLKAR